MLITLAILRGRVPYIVDALGADRVTVKERFDQVDEISFETADIESDFLIMFHAGIRCGSGKFKKIEENYKLQKS
jgi:hypothetical protein